MSFPVLITGVGMVNTAIGLTRTLSSSTFDLIINMGIAGSFTDSLNVGDIVEVTEDIFSEIGFENGSNFSHFQDFEIQTSYRNESKTSLKQVVGITVNTVHGNEGTIQKIINRLNPDTESMEGAVIFKICNEFDIPCMQIRSISNKVEKRNKENWSVNLAIKNLNIEVEKILNKL
jgi:futalosine hydrolase